MEPNKNFVRDVLIALAAGLILLLGIICYDSYNAAKSASDNVRRTIHDAETNSSTARSELRNAQQELSRGQTGITNAENTARSLENRANESAGIIKSSRQLIDEITAEFRDIDRANGIPAKETGNERTAK